MKSIRRSGKFAGRSPSGRIAQRARARRVRRGAAGPPAAVLLRREAARDVRRRDTATGGASRCERGEGGGGRKATGQKL